MSEHYLWHLELTLEDENSPWTFKDFVASPEFEDAYEVSKVFLKSERGIHSSGKGPAFDLTITKLERGIQVDQPGEV
jgi:hypothetical protein